MRCSRTVGTLMLALVMIATAPLEAVSQTPSGAVWRLAERKPTEPTRKAPTEISDALLTAKTKLALFSDKRVKARQVTVETANGVVTLRGKVDSDAARAAVISVAKGTEGVKSVRSDLQVVPPAERKAVDAVDKEITRRVEESLAKDGRLSKVGVRTDRGVVILTGEVPSPGAVARASEIALGVPGVRSLRNEVIRDPARGKHDRLLFALMLFAAMGRHGTVGAVRERTGEVPGRTGEAPDAGERAQEDKPRAVTATPATTQFVKGRIARVGAPSRQLTLEDGTVLTFPEDSHVRGPFKVGTFVRARYAEEHGQKLVRSITVGSDR